MDFFSINSFVREYADDTLRYLTILSGNEEEARETFVEVFRETALGGELTWECIKRNADRHYPSVNVLAVNG